MTSSEQGVRYNIEHVSRYRYDTPAQSCVMSLCLRPREDRGQSLHGFEITTEPAAVLSTRTDHFGNTHHVFNLHKEHDALRIVGRSDVRSAVPDPLPLALSRDAWPEARSWARSFDHWDFTSPSALTRPSAALTAFMDHHQVAPAADPLTDLLRLSNTLHSTFRYEPGATTVESKTEHILETGRGVCQDYAHVMIAIARSWGVPCRYVSGYLDDASLNTGTSVGTHAWVECLLPDVGWLGFDPTNNALADDQYIRVGVGRDYRDVSPTRGVLHGGGKTELEVDVVIRRVESSSETSS